MNEDDNIGGSRMLVVLLVAAALIAVLYIIFGRRADSEYIKTAEKYSQICQQFHFVKAEKAAEGLVRVYCLDKSGEKKEVLIDE